MIAYCSLFNYFHQKLFLLNSNENENLLNKKEIFFTFNCHLLHKLSESYASYLIFVMKFRIRSFKNSREYLHGKA